MRAGELDRLVDVRKNTPVESASGDPVDNFSSLRLVWAKVTQKQATEPFTSNQAAAFEVTEFKVRYESDLLDYTNIFVHNGKSYDIESIVELGRREGLLITGKAKVG